MASGFLFHILLNFTSTTTTTNEAGRNGKKRN